MTMVRQSIQRVGTIKHTLLPVAVGNITTESLCARIDLTALSWPGRRESKPNDCSTSGSFLRPACNCCGIVLKLVVLDLGVMIFDLSKLDMMIVVLQK